MRAGRRQRQDKLVILVFVDEKPVALDMAFSVAAPIGMQGMVFVFLGKRVSVLQNLDDYP